MKAHTSKKTECASFSSSKHDSRMRHQMNGVEHSICQCHSRRMPVKVHWFDVRPRMLVSSDSNTLIQREKGRVASDVSTNLGFNSHSRLLDFGGLRGLVWWGTYPS